MSPKRGPPLANEILPLMMIFTRSKSLPARALAVRAHSYRSLKSMLEKGLDRCALDLAVDARPVGTHENVRGAHYFTDKGEVH